MPIYKLPPKESQHYSFPPTQPKKALPQSKFSQDSPLPPPPTIDESYCESVSPSFPPPPPDVTPKRQRTSEGLYEPPLPESLYSISPLPLPQPRNPVRASQSFKQPPFLEQDTPFPRWPSSSTDGRQVVNPPARRHSTSSTMPHSEVDIYEEVGESRFRLPIIPDFSNTRNMFAKEGPMDRYVGSTNVVGLIKDTFRTFLFDVDAALVLFYDPFGEDCGWAKKGIKEAAEITKRPNHVYAAVDCTKETELCSKLNVTAFPTLKLFARGVTVNTFGQDAFLNSHDMKLFVESTPTVSSKRKQTCRVQ